MTALGFLQPPPELDAEAGHRADARALALDEPGRAPAPADARPLSRAGP